MSDLNGQYSRGSSCGEEPCGRIKAVERLREALAGEPDLVLAQSRDRDVFAVPGEVGRARWLGRGRQEELFA